MQLIYNGKVIRLTNCRSFYSRFRGFMGKTNIDEALMFLHCNSVHTFFMKQNIDIIMCDKDNRIIGYYPNVSKNRIIGPKRNVSKVIETPPYYFDIELGTKMVIQE